ncbi:MAG: amidophosphoribosyltransferase [Candidatus Nezhaarchaeota archaeon]|nr:amidophosphoribosyltransferase [Candidatus Nezhaarchaeota archaeon]MCX8141429.1 amidophosphoribosyltransferase [Candidatus Nezhaarchaeota archaeon]MDW8049695.1 amidophosphoribosyltransferase [Nitrososphaerota archaeon]
MNNFPFKAREKCGVVGITSIVRSSISEYIYKALYTLQHRGQESAGIAMFNGQEVRSYKGLGLVTDVITGEVLRNFNGHVGIGHVRYSTTPGVTIEEAQPLVVKNPKFSFSLAFNGTITNYLEIKERLARQGIIFMTRTDTEVLAKLLAKNLMDCRMDYVKAFKLTASEIDGACSMVLVNNHGELYAYRDPLGFKPLCIGRVNDLVVVASETCVLDVLSSFDGCEYDYVKPGELIRVCEGSIEKIQITSMPRRARCMFEYVYFSRPDSVFDGISVYRAREKIGRELAKRCPADGDVVVPVPDSGRTAALGYSLELGLPLTEGLMKNRYVGRTFIMPGQDLRDEMVSLKLNVVRDVVDGKRVVLVDDSIVRGTTMKRIVRLLRKGGAKEVHVRISCPPIISACYMGIDFPTRRELIAKMMTLEELTKYVEADSLMYNTIDGLVSGIGLPENELCLACLTGEYPLAKAYRFEELEEYLGRK